MRRAGTSLTAVRPPAVAGSFYPGEPVRLRAEVSRLLAAAPGRLDQRTAQQVLDLDADGLGAEQACGRTPLSGLLFEARRRGLEVVPLDLGVDVMKRLATTSTVVAGKPHHSNAVRAAGAWRPAMDHVGIDVHKRESQVCILTPDGEVEEVRIATTRERFREVLGERARARVLIETSTDSE